MPRWSGALVTMATFGSLENQTASAVTSVEPPDPSTRVTATGSAVPAARVTAGGQISSLPGRGSASTCAWALAAPKRARSDVTPASAPSTRPALGPSPTAITPSVVALQLAAEVRSTTVPSGQWPTAERRVRPPTGTLATGGTTSSVGVPAGARTQALAEPAGRRASTPSRVPGTRVRTVPPLSPVSTSMPASASSGLQPAVWVRSWTMPAPRMRSKTSDPSAPVGTTSSGGHTCQPSMPLSVASMKARVSSTPWEATTVPTPSCSAAVTSPADDTTRIGLVLLQLGSSSTTVPSRWVSQAERRELAPSWSASGSAGEISSWAGAMGPTSSSAWACRLAAPARTVVLPAVKRVTVPGEPKYPML